MGPRVNEPGELELEVCAGRLFSTSEFAVIQGKSRYALRCRRIVEAMVFEELSRQVPQHGQHGRT